MDFGNLLSLIRLMFVTCNYIRNLKMRRNPKETNNLFFYIIIIIKHMHNLNLNFFEITQKYLKHRLKFIKLL